MNCTYYYREAVSPKTDFGPHYEADKSRSTVCIDRCRHNVSPLGIVLKIKLLIDFASCPPNSRGGNGIAT
jgi:hypothetical protein